MMSRAPIRGRHRDERAVPGFSALTNTDRTRESRRSRRLHRDRSGRRDQFAAEKAHRARVVPDEPQADAHQRRFPGAVRAAAHEAGLAARRDLRRQSITISVTLRHADGLERGSLQHDHAS